MTPKSANTFRFIHYCAFHGVWRNLVSQQRSCDNELCRNTKNDRYLDPARSSHVWSLCIDESFLCFFAMLVDQVASFSFKISAPTTAVCSTVKNTWEQFIGGK